MSDQGAIGGVKNQGYLSLLLDGKTPPSTPNLVRSIQTFENTFAVPAALIVFADHTNILRTTHAIVDGTKITIIFGPDSETTSTLTFSVFSAREHDTDGVHCITVLCALDAPAFLFDSRSFTHRGTSIEALRKLATYGGLQFDAGDLKTNDIMPWISVAVSPKKAAHDIVEHMWISEEACPAMFISADKRMILRDLNALLEQDATSTLLFNKTPSGQSSFYNVQEFRPKSMSGIFNGMANYGETLLYSSSDGAVNKLSTVTVKGRDPLNMNSDTRESITGARKQMAWPKNDINLHKKYIDAWYSNKRQGMTYTETARALILGGAPDIDIFDVIEVESGIISGAPKRVVNDEKTSGKWIVAGRTRVFSGGMYSEALFLIRNFTPVEGTSNVGGGSNIILTPLSTVANVLRPFQINANIKQALNGSNPLDMLAQNHQFQLDVMLGNFQAQSEAWNFPELAAKYGQGVDYINALMQEFSMARFLTSICSALSQLEKLSVNLSINYQSGLLEALAGRVDSMEGLLSSMTSDINGLIANGDIPAEYLDGPQINQRCVSNKLDDMQKQLDDALPDNCLDAFSIAKLMGPSTNLAQLIRQAEENLRNFLCALGDGTVDGSNKTGTPTGQKLETYLPKVKS